MTITSAPQTDLLQTREGCIQLATAATENYRESMLVVVEAWVKGNFGPLSDLADAIGKSLRTVQLYQTDLRKQGRLPPSNFARTNPGKKKRPQLVAAAVENFEANPGESLRRSSAANVENVEANKSRSVSITNVENVQTIYVHVIEEKKEEKAMTDQEAVVFNGLVDLCTEQKEEINRLSANTNLVSNSNVRRPESEPQRSGDHLNLQSEWGNTDAEHWDHIQNCDEPDSYKKAQEQLTHFKRLLYSGTKEGWSQQAFAALRDDLEQYARTCAACSGNSRERLNAEVEARRACLPSAVQ